MKTALRCCAVALALQGCASEAITEIVIALPRQPDGDSDNWFVFLQARGDADPAPTESVTHRELRNDVSVPICASVVTDNHAIDELRVRVTFCRESTVEACATDVRMADWILERPFYPGRRTFLEARIDALPLAGAPLVTRLSRCDVRGCTSDRSATGYCVTEPGSSEPRHLCELDTNVDGQPVAECIP